MGVERKARLRIGTEDGETFQWFEKNFCRVKELCLVRTVRAGVELRFRHARDVLLKDAIGIVEVRNDDGGGDGVKDIKSGAEGVSSDGRQYRDW